MKDRRPRKRPFILSRWLRLLRLKRWQAAHKKALKAAAVENGAQSDLEAMAGAAIALDQKQIRDIMVSRSEVVFAYEDETPDEVLERVIKSGFTRLPVADKDEQKILGILHAKDLLKVQQSSDNNNGNANNQGNDRPRSIKSLMREAKAVPESMRISSLLDELKRKRLHMASVVDEYGGIAGIVTIEDIIEEIVGDIHDEHDKKEEIPKIHSVAPNTWEIKANIALNEFNAFFDSDLYAKDADTLGGLVLAQLGRIPKRGQQLNTGVFALQVEAVSRGRIQLLRVSKLAPQPPQPKAAS